MRATIALLAACLLENVYATPIGNTQTDLQTPLEDHRSTHHQSSAVGRLHGRFLHITGGVVSNLDLIFLHAADPRSRPTSRSILQNPFLHRRRRCVPPREGFRWDIWCRDLRLRHPFRSRERDVQMDRRKYSR
jgi:hypothetical protein